MERKNILHIVLSAILIGTVVLGAACAPNAAPFDLATDAVKVPVTIATEQVVVAPTSPPAAQQATQVSPRCAPEQTNWSQVSGQKVESGVSIAVGNIYSFDRPGVSAVFWGQNVDYTDPTGQTFRLTVSAENSDAVSRFVSAMALCFEAKQEDPPSDMMLLAQIDEIQPDGIFRQEVAKALGIDLRQWNDFLEKYSATNNVNQVGDMNYSLVSLLKWAGVDPNQVLDNSLAQFKSEWEARFGPQDEEQAFNVVAESYKAGLSEDGLDRFVAMMPPVPQPEGGGQAEDADIVMVQLDWLNYPKEKFENWRVSYALDPSLPQYKYHIYQWKWAKYVWTQIFVSNGSISQYLIRWNSGYNYRDISWTGGGSWSRKLSAGSYWSSYYSYRTQTYGWAAANSYTMYGMWWNSSYYTYP